MKCALTGIELKIGRRKEADLTTASLDRIDSNKPYCKNNIQWVHKQINLMKHAADQNEFIKFCKLVAEKNK